MEEKLAQFFINGNHEIIADADAAEHTGVVEVKSMDQLIAMGKDNILKIHASVFGNNSPADLKKSEKKLAKEIFDELVRSGSKDGGDAGDQAAKPEKKKRERKPKEPKDKAPSKMDKIRQIVYERGTITRKELAELISSDEANTHTMVSILKNPTRTKDPVSLQFDKATKIYGWPGAKMPAAPAPAATTEQGESE